MKKIARRNMLRTIGGISLAGLVPLNGAASDVTNNSVKKIETDILVVGGGTAGVIAAIQSARAGCSTILVENGSQLGGTTTTGGVAFPGLFHAWGKQIIGGIGWELVKEAVRLDDGVLPDFSIPTGKQHWKHQVRLNSYLYSLLAEEKCLEAGVQIRYYETPVKAAFKQGNWHVETMGKGTHTLIKCNQLIDCTGNAFVTSLAGFTVLRGQEIQPGTLMFKIGGYDPEKLDFNLIETKYNEAVNRNEHVRVEFRNIQSLLRSQGDNIQHLLNADSTTSETHTLTNINGRTSLLKMLRFLRTLPGCEKTHLLSMQQETAVRETYRIDGEYMVTHEDYVTGKIFDDSVSFSFYPIDLHDENGIIPIHLSENTVATVPLRALIPINSRNFLVAGRCVSSDRLANSALRVQASCMGMGQAAGAAAALANRLKTTPLNVPMYLLNTLIAENGGIVP
jgi:hypothetical protein